MAGIESGDKVGDKLVREVTLPESRVVEAPGLSGAVLGMKRLTTLSSMKMHQATIRKLITMVMKLP